MKGFTIYICFGKWAGFQLRHDFSYGIVFGFVSLMIIPVDIEKLLITINSAVDLHPLE